MKRRFFLFSFLFPSIVKAGVVYHPGSLVVEPAKKKPQILMYSTCPSCRVLAEQEIAAEKDTLEFEVVHKNEKAPARLEAYEDPTFWWAKDTDTPIESKLSTKVLGGWYGLKHLKSEFSKSREQPKQSQRAGSPAKVPFARPDLPSSRAVALNKVVFNPSHNCPTCGKTQFQIENDAGPNHTHRCKLDNTLWYHKDI